VGPPRVPRLHGGRLSLFLLFFPLFFLLLFFLLLFLLLRLSSLAKTTAPHRRPW
jgi:hypothetical protein